MIPETFLMLALAAAQDPPARTVQPAELSPGARVRVSTQVVNLRMGRVESVTAEALTIRPDGESEVWTVPRSELTKLEVSQGRRGRGAGAWRKAKWGALFGAVPGAISLGLQHEQVGSEYTSTGKAMALGAWSGAILGGLIGATIGAIRPGERWETVSPRLAFHSSDRGGGFSFAIAVGF